MNVRSEAAKARHLSRPQHTVRDKGRELTFFADQFDSRHSVTADGCWLWDGYVQERTGYGFASYRRPDGKWRTALAHRVSYLLRVGPIPEGMQLDHTCHTAAVERGECEGGPSCLHRRCVRPDHLEVVTAAVNTLRSMAVTAINKRKTRCTAGHSLADAYVDPRGRRTCRVCKRRNDAESSRRRAMAAGNP